MFLFCSSSETSSFVASDDDDMEDESFDPFRDDDEPPLNVVLELSISSDEV